MQHLENTFQFKPFLTPLLTSSFKNVEVLTLNKSTPLLDVHGVCIIIVIFTHKKQIFPIVGITCLKTFQSFEINKNPPPHSTGYRFPQGGDILLKELIQLLHVCGHSQDVDHTDLPIKNILFLLYLPVNNIVNILGCFWFLKGTLA